MSALFTPLKLRSLEIPNRVWMSPMCMYSAAPDGPETGAPTDFHLTHLASRAAGGAGLVMAEATGVRPDGRISPWDLGLWNDRQQEAFARITAAIRSHGAVPAIQLAHAGRKASVDKPWLSDRSLTESEGGWQPVSPSAEPYPGLSVPHELTGEEIQQLVRDFADSARRALAAGFQVVEVHGAHGYLINSFLSPVSNHRTDAYGGSFENRLRFPLQVVDAVREPRRHRHRLGRQGQRPHRQAGRPGTQPGRHQPPKRRRRHRLRPRPARQRHHQRPGHLPDPAELVTAAPLPSFFRAGLRTRVPPAGPTPPGATMAEAYGMVHDSDRGVCPVTSDLERV
ncbi:oxidoreductase [Streptomyces caelestis]|uniref:oxidoreductase n=1 Tax=Streptomyces caelestis TaxID=36816 RepID=UPI0036F5DE76